MRISYSAIELTTQMTIAASAIAGEVGWMGPTEAEVSAKSAEIEALRVSVRHKEMELERERSLLEASVSEGRELMKRVNNVLTAVYGRGALQKSSFGLRPEDNKRNRPPAPDAPEDVRLMDIEGGIEARWKRINLATYEIQWFGDSELSNQIGSGVSTRSKFAIKGLESGTELFVRVRATRGRRTSEWCEPVRRFVNG